MARSLTQDPTGIVRNFAVAHELLLRLVRTDYEKLGRRPGFVGPAGRVVPYFPVKHAQAVHTMLRRIKDFWLEKGAENVVPFFHSPEVTPETLKPETIKKWFGELTTILYRLDGVVAAWNPASVETAPQNLVLKYAATFDPPLVLRAKPTYDFLYKALRLSIHFAALAETPTGSALFETAIREQLPDFPNIHFPKFPDLGWLKWATYIGLGLGAYWVLKPKGQRR